MKHTQDNFTKGKWEIKWHRKDKDFPIVTGIGVKEKVDGGEYWTMIVDSILPETDEEYLKQKEEIEANAERIVDSVNMHDDLMYEVKSFQSENQRLREALESINVATTSSIYANSNERIIKIRELIKQALKQ